MQPLLRRISLLASLSLALAAAAPAEAAAPAPRKKGGTTAGLPTAPPGGPYCSGAYADDLAALSARAREFDQQQPPYTYCVRSTAVYECPSYAPDGSLRRMRRKVSA